MDDKDRHIQQLRELNAAHLDLFREVYTILLQWAEESQQYGWSTHQVKPQQELAALLFDHVVESGIMLLQTEEEDDGGRR